MNFIKDILGEGKALIGLEQNNTSHAEKLISALGALFGILSITVVSFWLFDDRAAIYVVASMGASAVLLFVVPHAAMSQPWQLAAGHLVAAAIGVSCQSLFPDHVVTAAIAVAVAIIAMQYLRCVHPPGGATALVAVIGGPQVHALGFGFVVMPVLLNVVCLLVIALAFNSLFSWRRYPAHLMKRRHHAVTTVQDRQLVLTQEDIEAAMQKLDTFIDVTTEELIELLELATQHAEQHAPHPDVIVPGHCYSNGRLGRLWSVRQVIDESGNRTSRKDEVIYKTVAGDGAYTTGVCERETFRQWARFEVVSCDGRWLRVQDQGARNAMSTGS